MVKRKVVFILNNFLVGGVERLVYDLISRLDKDKFDISIITVMGSGPWENRYLLLGAPIYYAGPRHSYQDNWRFKLLWIFMLPRTAGRMWFRLKQNRPQTIVTSLYHADIVGIWLGYLAGVKNRLVIQHDIQALPLLLKYLKKYLAVRLATKVVAVSKTVQEFVVGYFQALPTQVVVIPNGIDLSEFAGVVHPGLTDRLPTIGFIGRLEPVKGPGVLVEALGLLRKQYNLQPIVLIGGDGSLMDYLVNQTKRSQLTNVQFSGNVTNPAEWLRQIDVLVIPSFSEGFCLSVLEGLVAKKIVIASNLSAIRELVHDGENGLLFEPQNSDDLTAKLYGLLTDPELQQKISANVSLWHTHNAAKYGIKYLVNQYEQLLLET